MAYNVLQLKSDLTGALHGTTLNQITGIDNLIYRAARDVLMDVDPQETKVVSLLPNPIYDKVFDYTLPSDLKGNRMIDIRPTSARFSVDNFQQRMNKDFDLAAGKYGPSTFSILWNSGVKTLRINDINLNKGLTLDTATDSTGWTNVANTSNIKTNNTNFIAGAGSVQFDIDTGANPTTATINKTFTASLDASAYLNQASVFLEVYMPNASAVTSVTLLWGSTGSGQHWSGIVTTKFDGTAFTDGWNLVKVDWATATKTGTPSASALTYVRVSLTYDGVTQAGVCINNYVMLMGTFMEIEYYSKFLFRDSATGVFQESVTSDTNIINLDTETYNLLFYKVGQLAVQQQQGVDATFFDSGFFGNGYASSLARYKALYKSEVQAPAATYYQKPQPGYGKYLGRRTF